MSGVQAFWDAAAPMIKVTEKHPFLVAMVDGSLDMENFKYYVIQDALYLKDYADCLRRLAASADCQKQDSDRLNEFATGAEEAEMALHKSFFAGWGITLNTGSENNSDDDGDHDNGSDAAAVLAQQMPNCLLYTSYIKRIVATKSHAQGLATLLPCFWVYMHVGKCMLKLREQLGDSVSRPAQFDQWIDMYGGEEFEKEVKDYIAMVDAACQAADEKERNEMKQHFLMTCKLEHMFWDQASNMMQWPEIK